MTPLPEASGRSAIASYPTRLICLTEEPTEVLYALGQEHRIVGISRFHRAPAAPRREKPKCQRLHQRRESTASSS
jgi:ABC-type hemin transport system substrate-binding protein